MSLTDNSERKEVRQHQQLLKLSVQWPIRFRPIAERKFQSTKAVWLQTGQNYLAGASSWFFQTAANARGGGTERQPKKHGGTTFVVVGRTHDPSIMDSVIKPKRKEMKRAPGMSAICGRARILRKERPMKLFRLILLQFMSLIQQTGRICSPPKDSWQHFMCQRLLQNTRTSYHEPSTGQARMQMLGSPGTLLKKLEVVATDSSSRGSLEHFENQTSEG